MGTGAAGFSGCWPLAAHTLAGNDGLSRLGRRCTTAVERLDCAPEGIVLSFVELLHQWQLAEIRHAAYPPSSCLSCRFCLDKLEATAYRASLRESLTEEASDLKSHRTAIVSTPSCWSRVALQPACFPGPPDRERNKNGTNGNICRHRSGANPGFMSSVHVIEGSRIDADLSTAPRLVPLKFELL